MWFPHSLFQVRSLTSGSDLTWELVSNAVSGPSPELLSQNLQFHDIPEICKCEFETHWFIFEPHTV